MNKIGLKNFGIFKDYQEFDLKPITVLTGPNNSGKSTFSKLFKLLSEGFRTKNNIKEIDVLYFTDKLREQIGDFKSNVSWFSDDDFIEISFPNNGTIKELFDTSPDFHYTLILKYSKITSDTFTDYTSNLLPIKIQNKDVEAYLQNIKLLIEGHEVIELTRDEKIVDLSVDHYINSYESDSITDQLIWKCSFKKEYAKSLREVALNIKNHELSEVERAHKLLKTSDDPNFKYTFYWHYPTRKKFNKYFSLQTKFIFPSLLSEIVINKNNFFKEKNLEENYFKKIRNILLKNKIDSIEDFIDVYRDFEEKFILETLITYFGKLYTEWTEQQNVKGIIIDNLHKILGYEKYSKNDSSNELEIISKIENPLTNLLISELKIIDTPKYKELLGSFHDSKKISFEQPAIEIINKCIIKPYLDTVGGLKKLKIKQYQQSEYLHDYYLKSDSTVVQSTIYRFAEYFNKGLIQKETIDFINKWVKKLGIGDEIVIKVLKIENEIIGYAFLIKKNNRMIPVTTNGLGIRKVIKLLLELSINNTSKFLKVKELKNTWNNEGGINGTILLEEPESNLHPAFQSLLVELLVDATHIFAINIIIETHSEYIIRKLQYLTAKKKIVPYASVIYYFHHPDKIPKGKGEKHIKEINIEEDGSLSDDFGPGFFDEATNMKFELMRLKNSQKN